MLYNQDNCVIPWSTQTQIMTLHSPAPGALGIWSSYRNAESEVLKNWLLGVHYWNRLRYLRLSKYSCWSVVLTCFNHLIDKYEFVNWKDDIPYSMENKINVSNHQPAWVWFYKTTRSSINLFLINWLVGEFHPGQKLPGFAITFLGMEHKQCRKQKTQVLIWSYMW